jgi:hypothetical protein
VNGLAQFGSSSGTQVGLALGTDSCNAGVENLNWFALPNNDHPVIPQNLYRMSGGTLNNDRFEQIGQSNVKHAFTALTLNLCGFGCNGIGGSQLGSGCSDPYSAGLNSGPNLGSRAWINPFTGFYPRGDSGTSPNSHSAMSIAATAERSESRNPHIPGLAQELAIRNRSDAGPSKSRRWTCYRVCAGGEVQIPRLASLPRNDKDGRLASLPRTDKDGRLARNDKTVDR